MPLPPVPKLELISQRLPIIFPEGTENRNYVIREMAARVVFVMFYSGAIEGADRWIRPSQVADMSNDQAALLDDTNREAWVRRSLSSKKERSQQPWYASDSREPIRDETLRNGFIVFRAVIERKGIATTSSHPRYALERDFAALFNPALSDEALEEAAEAWRDSHLSVAALARQRLIKHGASVAGDSVPVIFPNGETRSLAPGPSSIIAKAVIEEFAPRFLKQPAVLWLSESGNKVVARDEALAKALRLKIDSSKALPDIILIDLGDSHAGFLVVFVEVVASDGPINRERKEVLSKLAKEAGFQRDSLAFLTAFHDRAVAPFRKSISELAWGSYAWFVSEPQCIIELREGRPFMLSRFEA